MGFPWTFRVGLAVEKVGWRPNQLLELVSLPPQSMVLAIRGAGQETETNLGNWKSGVGTGVGQMSNEAKDLGEGLGIQGLLG